MCVSVCTCRWKEDDVTVNYLERGNRWDPLFLFRHLELHNSAPTDQSDLFTQFKPTYPKLPVLPNTKLFTFMLYFIKMRSLRGLISCCSPSLTSRQKTHSSWLSACNPGSPAAQFGPACQKEDSSNPLRGSCAYSSLRNLALQCE